MDFSSINNYASRIQTSAYSAQTDKLKSLAGGIDKDSTYEDLEGAAKQFESYLLEHTIKEFKKSMDELKGEEDKDDYASQTTDVFMDQTIQTIAESMVDQYGQRLTKELADQMARNVGVEIPDETPHVDGVVDTEAGKIGSAPAVSEA